LTAARDIGRADQELAHGDVLHGEAHLAIAGFDLEAGLATAAQGGLEVSSVAARLAGATEATWGALGEGAELMGRVAGPLAGAAGIVTGGLHMYDALNHQPPQYGEAVVGGLQAVAGAAMFFPPEGEVVAGVIGAGLFAYEHWDQITHEAAHVEQAITHAASDAAHRIAHFFGA